MKQSRIILVCIIIFFVCAIMIGWLVIGHKRRSVQQVPDKMNVSTFMDAESHLKQRMKEKRAELDRQGVSGKERKRRLQIEEHAAALELKQTLEKSGVKNVTVF